MRYSIDEIFIYRDYYVQDKIKHRKLQEEVQHEHVPTYNPGKANNLIPSGIFLKFFCWCGYKGTIIGRQV